MKIDDTTNGKNKMHSLTTLVVFENEIPSKDKELAQKAGLILYTL